MDLKNLSSNWKILQASGGLVRSNSATNKRSKSVRKDSEHNGTLKRKRHEPHGGRQQQSKSRLSKKLRRMSSEQVDVRPSSVQITASKQDAVQAVAQKASDRVNEGLAKDVEIGKYLALDCEMVGVGPYPHLESALARVSIANYNGDQVYDSYVKPQEEVTDWRTHVSGIQPKHMFHARSLEEVQADVAALLKGRIVVGHSVRGDFEALFLDHPKRDIRDTARHPPYRKLAGGGSPKLKILASELLGLDIQAGEHSSIEDAQATMLLFRRDKDIFEREHIKKWGPTIVSKKTDTEATVNDSVQKARKKKKKKKR